MANLFKKIVPFKYKRKIKEHLGVPGLHWSLQNLKRAGFNPGIIIDIGAYEGQWTYGALEVFPRAKVLMVEAQESKEKKLGDISESNPNINYIISLLSAEEGKEKSFLEDETGSRVIDNSASEKNSKVLQTHTLDLLLTQKTFPYPDLLKLDVQGHELEVLQGAGKSLANAEICLLEVSLLDFGDRPPLLYDVVCFMNERNFQAYDISQLMRRPFDRALFQLDMFFIKKDSSLLVKRWR